MTAHLAARVAELQAALDHVTRELGEKWRPRLLELERDVDALLRIMQPRGARTPDAGDEG
ncbi:MAG: hypothetical protein Q8Q14_02920 [Gemmatimonadales bacterium]|nr:hypothetical protein [Gemmatimonadales bacterium]